MPKFQVLLFILGWVSVGYGQVVSVNVDNQAPGIYLTHCAHYQPISGIWEPDDIKYYDLYTGDHQKSFTIKIDGRAYFSCDAYVKGSTVNGSSAYKQVAVLEMYVETGLMPIINWLPDDRQHPSSLNNPQTLNAHLEMSGENPEWTVNIEL